MAKQEFFIFPKCNECILTCKKYLAMFLKESFDQGGVSFFCGRQTKEISTVKRKSKKRKDERGLVE